jgi:hypothetical protein
MAGGSEKKQELGEKGAFARTGPYYRDGRC